MPRVLVESDVCIIGSGISAAMVAEKLAAERNASIVVVEAGEESDRLAARPSLGLEPLLGPHAAMSSTITASHARLMGDRGAASLPQRRPG
jgi:choline dehydrogenase-like flavoprotein